ncbi:MAG: hypothetical protein Q8N38_08425 [Bacteroidales bacterium]|nr:hypothetical protein [Bacteroidales bacterium]
MYVFTSDAISGKPVIFLYNTSFLAIRAMLNGVEVVTTALFFVFKSLYRVERAVTFKSALSVLAAAVILNQGKET